MINQFSYKVLLVDNCDFFHNSVKGNIFFGFDLTFVTNGELAVKKLENEIFHAVIFKVDMSDMSGLVLAEKIRRLNLLNKHIIIVGVIATPSLILKKAFDSGINKLFSWPIEIPEIPAYLKNSLSHLGY